MSEMVERVAKVLFGWMHGHDQWDDAQPEEREDCIEAARAVMQCMRDPTDDMRMAGLYRGPLLTDRVENPDAPWVRMIDEAHK